MKIVKISAEIFGEWVEIRRPLWLNIFYTVLDIIFIPFTVITIIAACIQGYRPKRIQRVAAWYLMVRGKLELMLVNKMIKRGRNKRIYIDEALLLQKGIKAMKEILLIK